MQKMWHLCQYRDSRYLTLRFIISRELLRQYGVSALFLLRLSLTQNKNKKKKKNRFYGAGKAWKNRRFRTDNPESGGVQEYRGPVGRRR